MNWTLAGLKTHLVVAIAIAVEGARQLGYIDPELARTLECILGMLGLSTVRAGVAKAEAAAKAGLEVADAATAPSYPPTPRRDSGAALPGLLVLIASLWLAAGCQVDVHRYDPATVDALEKAVEHRRADAAAWLDTVAKARAGARGEDVDVSVRILQVRNESEIGRLEAALLYERSKKEDP